MLDLNDLNQQIDATLEKEEEGVPVTIYKTDGETPYVDKDKKPLVAVVLGAESEKVKAQMEANGTRTRGRRRKPEDVLENRIRTVIAATVSLQGQPPVEEELRTLFRANHILVQFEEGIFAHASFFTNGSTT